jgi:hypothetical protein
MNRQCKLRPRGRNGLLAMACVAAVGAGAAGPASATWDGVINGKITQIDTITETNNFEFRVYLGVSPVCTTNATTTRDFAYMNSSDPNYKATVANLMMAYSTGKNVTLYTMNDGGIGCHLHYATVKD